MHHNQDDFKFMTLTTPDLFARWVRVSLAKLDMRPCHFLLDEGVPGSANRVRIFLRNPGRIKLATACRLHDELQHAAQEQGIALGQIEPVEAFRAESLGLDQA